MILIDIQDGVTAQLVGSQAFIYADDSSEVLNIEGIENNSDAVNIIKHELELLSRDSFSDKSFLLN